MPSAAARSTGASSCRESLIVRVDYIVRCPDGVPETYDVSEIEARIAEVDAGLDRSSCARR